jgi:hypothetical protein
MMYESSLSHKLNSVIANILYCYRDHVLKVKDWEDPAPENNQAEWSLQLLLYFHHTLFP